MSTRTLNAYTFSLPQTLRLRVTGATVAGVNCEHAIYVEPGNYKLRYTHTADSPIHELTLVRQPTKVSP